MAISTSTFTLDNGEVLSMAKVTSGEYTGYWGLQTTAPNTTSFNKDGGYYSGTLRAVNEYGVETVITVTDASFGEMLKLFVKETTCPTITNISPSEDAYLMSNRPTFKFNVADEPNGSGINYDEIIVMWDATTADEALQNETLAGLDFSGEVSAAYHDAENRGWRVPATNDDGLITFNWSENLPILSDGEHTFTFFVADNDGNTAGGITWQTEMDTSSAAQYSTYPTTTFTVDTVVPELNVTAPIDDFKTNEETVTIIGTATDVTGTTTVKITVGSTEYNEITLGSDGAFEQEVTLSPGENTITITATDSAGGTTTIVRTVSYSTTKPVILDVVLTPNPVATGTQYLLYAKFADDE